MMDVVMMPGVAAEGACMADMLIMAQDDRAEGQHHHRGLGCLGGSSQEEDGMDHFRRESRRT